jgi:hypothetical protein
MSTGEMGAGTGGLVLGFAVPLPVLLPPEFPSKLPVGLCRMAGITGGSWAGAGTLAITAGSEGSEPCVSTYRAESVLGGWVLRLNHEALCCEDHGQ